MAKKIFTVKISEEDSKAVEKAWYEYSGARDIIAFIMQQKGVDWNILQEYVNVAEYRFTVCEMEKNRVATSYKPEEVDLSKYNYSFDFLEHSITFEEA